MTDKHNYAKEPRWYVVHTYSGYENKVQSDIENSIKNLHLEDKILQVVIPKETVIEYKDGRRKEVTRKLFPAYVLIHMILTDDTWFVVRNTRGVTGFVGPESEPVPLTEEEMKPFGLESEDGAAALPEDEIPIVVDLELGDIVTIADGEEGELSPFNGMEGVVREIDPREGRVSVGIEMDGPETIYDFDITQVRRKN